MKREKHSLLSIFIAVIYCLVSCASLAPKGEEGLVLFKGFEVNPPMESKIRLKNIAKINPDQTIYLGKNIGKKRYPTEALFNCFSVPDKQTISWSLSNLITGSFFNTPLDIVLIFSGGKEVFHQRFQNNYLWNERINKAQDPLKNRLPYYPHKEKVLYQIMRQGDRLDFFTGKHKQILTRIKDPKICLGLRRTSLLRYKGKVVPKQSITLQDIH